MVWAHYYYCSYLKYQKIEGLQSENKQTMPTSKVVGELGMSDSIANLLFLMASFHPTEDTRCMAPPKDILW